MSDLIPHTHLCYDHLPFLIFIFIAQPQISQLNYLTLKFSGTGAIRIVGRVLALHATGLGSVPTVPYPFQELFLSIEPQVSPDHSWKCPSLQHPLQKKN